MNIDLEVHSLSKHGPFPVCWEMAGDDALLSALENIDPVATVKVTEAREYVTCPVCRKATLDA